MARALMIQGTGSSVGKSVLCAALCRILARRGLRVAPFKAQNMSNNAFVTAEGGEISRAQAVQAAAARIAPSVDMNPVLLKPEGDQGSQVVLHGKVWGRLRAADYLTRKTLLWDAVEESLGRLLAEYDVVIVEGAGSPAEVNLRAGDIVNMRVARAAEAPVLLVGDIDRGGVFASLVGTLELLEPADRERIAGFLINRFRGNLDLLSPGLDFLQQRTGKPVLGVIPYLRDLELAEEDAAMLTSAPRDHGRGYGESVRGRALVAAIRLPCLSNFDDLDPLRRAGTEVTWVERPAQLGRPELIVLPGSKQTASDLRWLRATGLAAPIVELADRGVPVLAFCGGYQMLGEAIDDPEGVESSPGSIAGLGLLPTRTVLRRAKTTRQTRGRVLAGRGLLAGLEGARVEGYEIHVGETNGPGLPLLELEGHTGTQPEGRSSRSGWIVGTYLHGLLHNAGFAEALVAALAARRQSGHAFPELARGESQEAAGDPYDRLADQVERAVDLPRILALLDLRPVARQ
jgi:adenosylcobyric acid synthase